MCMSCNEGTRIFSVALTTSEPVNNDRELYQAIANRLLQHKVISLINIGANRAYLEDGQQMFGFEMHLSNRHDPALVTLERIEQALEGVLNGFDGYNNLTIAPHAH